MSREKLKLTIQLSVIAAVIVYCWVQLLKNGYIPDVRHYAAPGLFLVLLVLVLKLKIHSATIAIGVFLLIATFHGISLSARLSEFWFRFGPITTLKISTTGFALLVGYLIMNATYLVDTHLENKEKRNLRKKNPS